MWPRLVASKILRKRLGSNNFVTDFSSNAEAFLEIPSSEQSSLSPKTIFNHNNHVHKVFVSTWNVGGVAPHVDLNMEDLLDSGDTSCDIYVLGFQEIVPLRASNVLGCENSRISMKWNSLIREALNKKIRFRDKEQYDNLQEIQSQFPAKNGKSIESTIPQDYHCIISKQMVGILISVWVRNNLRPFIRDPSVSCVGCGIMGCLGNKGAVSVRFRLHETSFCFVCSHLASGGREVDGKYRNSNVAEILSRTIFPRGPLLDLPPKILDHDRVILIGDLNYRISMPEATTRSLANREEWSALLESDQLRMELMDGQVFQDWQEGTIKFPPTYKYYPNSDIYYGSVEGKKGEKRRAPAWCDRIIWYGKGLKQQLYTRVEQKLSDHRPVKAIFTAEVGFSQNLEGLQSFFLSDRISSCQFEVSSTDDIILCKDRSSSFQL
ncbi:Type I inositol 1,4,5-trisphosphate 5-phosphatase CVP2 [Morella rubra]|uniref:Type I inositol 1,4,5-trisphosphate 5-phosphatase CVP2 n=1 Tax=Morella rubra TaxID=262757 RepID=A0A6A1V022_9ROSI|nr:Type I inositol 1,4,5-trisphosphate 5-phosphatase CVP2 [Morella rubra]